MKRMRKKLMITVIAAQMLMLSVMAIPVSARTGDVIGKVLYTNILATINDYHIASFNVKDYTYIVAEDLMNYGFTVVWNQEERTLSVTKDENNTEVISKYEASYVSNTLLGKKAFDILETDIVTYVNGEAVHSYNINGKTIIQFDSLAPFGAITWHPDKREISASIASLNWNPNKKPNPSLVKETEPYQGIFMKGDIFLYIPIATYSEPGEPFAGIDRISRPKKGAYGYLDWEHMDNVGDVYKSSKGYVVQDGSFSGKMIYTNNGIILEGTSYGKTDYAGEYVQVSNAGADMTPNMIWLNIPSN